MSLDLSKHIQCPFTIIVDKQEKIPYTFQDIKSNKDEGNKLYIVNRKIEHMKTGDYTIQGMEDKIVIERKSKTDLFQSIVKRDNFIARLERMERFKYAAVIVEDDLEGISQRPPPDTSMNPLSVIRTILSWDLQYKTKWWLLPGRRLAEKITFRLLYMAWKHENDARRVTRGPKRYPDKWQNQKP